MRPKLPSKDEVNALTPRDADVRNGQRHDRTSDMRASQNLGVAFGGPIIRIIVLGDLCWGQLIWKVPNK